MQNRQHRLLTKQALTRRVIIHAHAPPHLPRSLSTHTALQRCVAHTANSVLFEGTLVLYSGTPCPVQSARHGAAEQAKTPSAECNHFQNGADGPKCVVHFDSVADAPLLIRLARLQAGAEERYAAAFPDPFPRSNSTIVTLSSTVSTPGVMSHPVHQEYIYPPPSPGCESMGDRPHTAAFCIHPSPSNAHAPLASLA